MKSSGVESQNLCAQINLPHTIADKSQHESYYNRLIIIGSEFGGGAPRNRHFLSYKSPSKNMNLFYGRYYIYIYTPLYSLHIIPYCASF